jgi:hypothetical protein
LTTCLTSDKKVVFSHPGHDIGKDNNGLYYFLSIVSLVNFQKTEVKHNYKPVPLTDSIKTKYTRQSSIAPPAVKQLMSIISEIIEKEPNYPPLQKLLADGNLIFAVTWNQNSDEEYLVDVFDMDKNQYVRSAWFKIVPDAIKNGFAYRLKTGRDVFAEVEVYRIDPRVYGK